MGSCLCAKEVATYLGVGTRLVQQLMATGEIEAMRVGPRLWRTDAHKVEDYKQRQFAHSRCRRLEALPLLATVSADRITLLMPE